MRCSNLATALLLSVASAGTALGAEGRIPILEPVLLDGTTGNISGKYVVTRDVQSSGTVAMPFAERRSSDGTSLELCTSLGVRPL